MIRRNERGMTLIEILLALIVMVIGIVGILALFPPALESAKSSMEETNAAIVAESVAHSMTTGIRFAAYDPATQVWTVIFTHDLKNGTNFIKYSFALPNIAAGWRHHPGNVTPAQNPEQDPNFRLKGDGWIASTHDYIGATNDPSDPYHQFAFSFAVRKINTLQYMVNNPAFINPATNQQYTLADIEPMVKLYEFRIHVFRTWSTAGFSGGGTTTTTPGSDDKSLVATVTSRVSTK